MNEAHEPSFYNFINRTFRKNFLNFGEILLNHKKYSHYFYYLKSLVEGEGNCPSAPMVATAQLGSKVKKNYNLNAVFFEHKPFALMSVGFPKWCIKVCCERTNYI